MLLIGVFAIAMSAAVWQKRRVAWKAFCREKFEYHARLGMSWHNVSEGLAREAVNAMRLAEDSGATEKKRRFARYVARSNQR
jgi:hypothetical protein